MRGYERIWQYLLSEKKQLIETAGTKQKQMYKNSGPFLTNGTCRWFGLILVIFCGCIASCGDKREQTQPSVENITEAVYATGIVKSRSQYQAYATVNGIVGKIFVSEGDYVQKGEPILQVTNETVRLNSENARIAAEYASIRSNLDKLREQRVAIDLARVRMENDSALLHRQQELWSRQIGTKNELEQRALAYKNSKSAYSSALLNYNELEKQVNFSARQAEKNLEISNSIRNEYIIRSAIAGRVYDILKEEGEIVAPQAPLAVIGAADSFMLELQADEYDIVKIKTGQQVLVTMDSHEGQVFEATVSRIIPIMNEQSRSVVLEANFIRQPDRLIPNLTAEANIIISKKDSALTIPRSYLAGDTAVVVEGNKLRKVTTGLKDYRKVEITDGLERGETIYRPE